MNEISHVRPAGERNGVERNVDEVWTIVVGGGSGQRFGKLKQYELVSGQRVIDWSTAMARQCSDGVVIVVPGSDAEREGAVAGGATRSESVRAGLARVPEHAQVICVHDAARPLATAGIYARVIEAVRNGADAAIPGVAVTDTVKVLDRMTDAGDGHLGVVIDTPDRSTLVAVQTPQAFRADRLRAAHADAGDATDDAALVESAGGRVVVVDGDVDNRKITEPADLEWVERRLTERETNKGGAR